MTGIILLLLALVAVPATGYAAADDLRLVDAAKRNEPSAVRALLDEGLDVNARHPDGSTALLWATYYDDVDTVGVLLDAGADVHAAMTVRQMDQFTLGLVETFDGQTPLWLAITNCRKDGLEYFGSTEPHPVGLTCPANEELGILFLEHGAHPNAADGAQFLPLQRAVQTGMEDLVAALLRHGADPNAPVASDVRQWTGKSRGGARNIRPVPIGATPFFLAAWTHNPDIMRALLAAGADPYANAADGSTPLHAAAGVPGRPPMGYSSHLEPPTMLAAVQIALDEGADVNAANQAGRTAMHGAADIKSTELIQFLFDNGGRLDVADDEGETPLTLAGVGELYDDSKANAATKLLRELAGL